MSGRIETEAEKLVQNLLADTEYEFVDLDYIKEKNWYLRVFIDKQGGIDLDDCQKVSRFLDEAIEKVGLIKDSYILEVSSPGLDRLLRKDRDFAREMGKDVDVVTYAPLNGKKEFTGKLTSFDDKTITLNDALSILRTQLASVRLHIDF
ncbi:ribosome maturation factor RimP [Pectinatus frisingensis]|jgi:ribosome maturation factor RimP|uniref:ribosome maturation factor RimP n=1 Tax=Pectinatus frisingensis TaxID=865 RepID=UPI0015F66F3F|nr:ribosome maturation factor RimP [Pectinatus frisingensis]